MARANLTRHRFPFPNAGLLRLPTSTFQSHLFCHVSFLFVSFILVQFSFPADMTEPQEAKGKAPEQDDERAAENSPADESAAEPSTSTEGSSGKKIKKLFGRKSKDTAEPGSADGSSGKKLPPQMIESLLQMNPALAGELAGMDKEKAAETLHKMDISDLLTGMSLGSKNQKDMASYKFWATQPVPHFNEKEQPAEGPIKIIKPEEVPNEPYPLLEGFEWVTLDLTDDNEVAELYDLLSNHYVEDDNAMFRFKYSRSFLHWYVFCQGEMRDGPVIANLNATK